MAKLPKLNYQNDVLNVNRSLKEQRKTLGGCIKELLFRSQDIGLNPQMVKTLKHLSTDNNAFRAFKKQVRKGSHKGKSTNTHSPFYVLQLLYKDINTELSKDEIAVREANKQAKAKKKETKKNTTVDYKARAAKAAATRAANKAKAAAKKDAQPVAA